MKTIRLSAVIAGLILACAPLVRGQGSTEVIADPLGQRLDHYFTKAVANGFAGSALVARRGTILLAKGYGQADRESEAPETAQTVFDIGSITKQFTAAAILKLEMQGKLSVEDPLTKFFKQVPEDKKGITLRQLLTHTAGFADSLGDDYDPIGRDAFVDLALKSKLVLGPGEGYRYSNVGYSLLGIVVELASGAGYERYLYDNLWKPAGMEHTGYLRPRYAKGDLAVAYGGAERWGTPLDHPWLPDGPGWHLRANGGVLSTPADLYRWFQAMRAEKILSPEATRQFLTAHVQEDSERGSFYSFGWVVERTSRGTPFIWHNGGNGFSSAFMGFEPKEGVVVIVSSNVSGKVADVYADRVEKLLSGEFQEMDEKQLGDWTGSYYSLSGAGVSVRFDENDNLVASFEDAEFIPWLAASGQEKKEDVESYNRRTKAIVSGSLAGDYAALAQAWGEPVADVAKRAPSFWGAFEKNGGPILSQDILGTVARADSFLTYARLKFRKGSLFLTFVWKAGRLVQLRDSLHLERAFRPKAGAGFAATEIAKTASFVKDKFDRWVLVIAGAGGEVRLVRG